jgi:hypothetical protein
VSQMGQVLAPSPRRHSVARPLEMAAVVVVEAVVAVVATAVVVAEGVVRMESEVLFLLASAIVLSCGMVEAIWVK